MIKIKVEEHRLFKKYYKKLSEKQKILYKQRLGLLQTNYRHPLLKLHNLSGDLKGCYAFSLGGDLRVDKNHILLVKIGTHNQVY